MVTQPFSRSRHAVTQLSFRDIERCTRGPLGPRPGGCSPAPPACSRLPAAADTGLLVAQTGEAAGRRKLKAAAAAAEQELSWGGESVSSRAFFLAWNYAMSNFFVILIVARRISLFLAIEIGGIGAQVPMSGLAVRGPTVPSQIAAQCWAG